MEEPLPSALHIEEDALASICTSCWVEALNRAGQREEARLIFEKMLRYANHLGLCAE
jgi:pentatricopeptide repeat protein